MVSIKAIIYPSCLETLKIALDKKRVAATIDRVTTEVVSKLLEEREKNVMICKIYCLKSRT
jgi:ribosomal protein L25 (general stress protein Ctc)